MAYKLYLKRSAEKELSRLQPAIHDRIVQRLLSLQDNPMPPGTKKLLGREGFRIRVGAYRILYIIDEKAKKIEVISIAHRKDAYR